MEDLSHALRAFSAFVQGNMRAGSDANAGGGVRMLGPPQRAPTLPALGYGVDSQNSTGRDTDCESQPLSIGGIPALADGDGTTPRPQPSGAPHPLAIDAGRTSSEDVSRRECGLALALADAPPPAHTATAATLHAVHAAAPSAATAAALEEAQAEVDDMIKRQQSVITKRRLRLQGKQPVGQARVVAEAPNRHPHDLASTIVADDDPSTPLSKRARTSAAHTGEKDHPPPTCPGTAKHDALQYNGFRICNSTSKNKWRVVPFCRPTYDKGFGYFEKDAETVWADVIEYCHNPTIPKNHWEALKPEDQAKFSIVSAEAPAAIAPIVGCRASATRRKRARR